MKVKELFIKVPQLFKQYKTPIFYTSASMVRAFSTLIVGFVIAKYISPEDLGLWATINIAVTYSLLLQAGLINGLNLELPLSYGKGDNKEAKKMAGTVQSFTIISSLLVFTIGLSIFLFYPIENIKIKYGALVITFLIIFKFYQNYLTSTFRSNNSFLKLSYIQMIDSIVNLITLILVVYFSYYGLILKALIVFFIYTLLLHFSRPVKVGWLFDIESLKKTLKVGLPIFALGYIESIASTTDKLLLLVYSDLANVGLYSFGFYSLSIFSLFSMSVATYVYPRMTFTYAQTGNKLILWKYVRTITIILFIIQLPLAIIGCYLIPLFITTYFPTYILSVTTMQILLFAGFFKGCVVGSNALWSIKNWKYMTFYQMFYSFLLISLPYIGVQIFENKIEGVAYGVLIANFLNLISGLYLTHSATHKN